MDKDTIVKDKINYKSIDNMFVFITKYDKESDTLTFRPKKAEPSVSVNFNDDFWVRVNPETNNIVGIDVENYKTYFSKKYHEYLRGRRINDPFIKLFVATLLKFPSGIKSFTRESFLQDLKRVSARG